jgi:hypothetical protein
MGDYADDILNGDVDQYTGEWIGEGQGFSRSIDNTSNANKSKNKGMGYNRGPHKDRWSGNRIHPVYNTILQLSLANRQVQSICKNKKGTITFLHKFYMYENIHKDRTENWEDYREVITTYKKEFKDYIKIFTTNILK